MTDLDRPFSDEASRRAAERALDSVTDERPCSVEPIGRGNHKRTTLVRFDARRPVVVQLCDDPARIRTEATLLSMVRERTSVPVPRVLAADVTEGVAVMVTSYVRGADLHEGFTGLSPDAQRRIARAFGIHLGQLHESFRFEGYGPLAADGDGLPAVGGLTAQAEGWDDWFAEYGRRAVRRLPAEFDPIRADLRALFADPGRDRSPPSHLFPWDFRPGNAVVDDGSVTAVLDWEVPLAAAPALSAAKAEYLVADWYVEDPGPLRTAFVTGYETVSEYPAVRPVHRVAAVADSAVDSTGAVTNPGYPELDRDAAVAFHREALADLV